MKYMHMHHLDTKKEEQEFGERLAKLGLSQAEIKFYESLFTSTDLIIFRESLLKEDFFLESLSHERFHRTIKQVSNEKYEMLRQAA